jgi:uncharacterized protein YbcV (DUF1398 family)
MHNKFIIEGVSIYNTSQNITAHASNFNQFLASEMDIRTTPKIYMTSTVTSTITHISKAVVLIVVLAKPCPNPDRPL